jgi:four helix bundle protein
MNYKDLRVYQFADKARIELYQELIKISYSSSVSEVDQVKRSSSSVTSNIVEGFGRKFYQKDFFKYLSIALASSDETQNHIRVLFLNKYLEKEKADGLEKQYKNLSIQILNLMNVIRKNNNF